MNTSRDFLWKLYNFPFVFRATSHLEYVFFAWCEVGANFLFSFFPCDYPIDPVQLIKNVYLSLLVRAATFIRSKHLLPDSPAP